MDWVNKIKMYYNWSCYTHADVWDFVVYEKITKKQYKEITGQDFPSERPITKE